MEDAQKNILKVFRLQTVLKECGHDMNVSVFAHTDHVDWRIYVGGYSDDEVRDVIDGGFYYAGPLATSEDTEKAVFDLLTIIHEKKMLWS